MTRILAVLVVVLTLGHSVGEHAMGQDIEVSIPLAYARKAGAPTVSDFACAPPSLVAVMLDDRSVEIWDWRLRKVIRRLSSSQTHIGGLCFSNDGKRLAVCCIGGVRSVEVESGLERHLAVASRDVVFVGNKMVTTAMWGVYGHKPNGEQSWSRSYPESEIVQALSAAGTRVAVGTTDRVDLLDADTGEGTVVRLDIGVVTAVAGDGEYLVCIGERAQCLPFPGGHGQGGRWSIPGQFGGVAVPKGAGICILLSRVTTGEGRMRLLRVVDVRSGRVLHQVEDPAGEDVGMEVADIDRDHVWFATAGDCDRLTIWRTKRVSR